MARDGEAVDPAFAAAVASFVQGERFQVAAKCRELGVSRERFYKYVHRFQAQGVEGLFPRSRRPLSSPTRLPADAQDALVALRKAEADTGWDYGADAVRLVLTSQPERWLPGRAVPSRSTINRVFKDRGQLPTMPQRAPRQRPWRFQRERVNELWQYDGFEWTLPDGFKIVVLHLSDDCSRLDLALQVAYSENSNQVWEAFCVAARRYGLPSAVLTDNGTAFSGRRRGWTGAFETNLNSLSVRSITSRVHHPQTCGKNERAHQRVLKWLRHQPLAADTLELQAQLDAYRQAYNQRPNQVLDGLSPQQRYDLGPTAGPALPGTLQPPLHVTWHTVATNGSIGLDRTLTAVGKRYKYANAVAFRRGDLATIFINDQLIRTLIIDRTRYYQPLDP